MYRYYVIFNYHVPLNTVSHRINVYLWWRKLSNRVQVERRDLFIGFEILKLGAFRTGVEPAPPPTSRSALRQYRKKRSSSPS